MQKTLLFILAIGASHLNAQTHLVPGINITLPANPDAKSKAQQSYQLSQPLSPPNGYLFTEEDLKKPISFRWTPVIPRPRETLTYRLRVWQLMQGQNGLQATQINQPIITKDVDNITQVVINNLLAGPCKPPYLCEFIWNVQALNRDGKPIGENNGTSEGFTFKRKIVEIKGDQSPESISGGRNSEKK